MKHGEHLRKSAGWLVFLVIFLSPPLYFFLTAPKLIGPEHWRIAGSGAAIGIAIGLVVLWLCRPLFGTGRRWRWIGVTLGVASLGMMGGLAMAELVNLARPGSPQEVELPIVDTSAMRGRGSRPIHAFVTLAPISPTYGMTISSDAVEKWTARQGRCLTTKVYRGHAVLLMNDDIASWRWHAPKDVQPGAGATATDAGIAPDIVCAIRKTQPWLYRCAARPSPPPA